MAGALSGIRAVELAVMQNGPACGYMLGDMGAEVIKIEDPVRGDSGRGLSALEGVSTYHRTTNIFYETTNRNKRGITLDLKKEKGREVLYRLVSKSDVFFTNFSKRVCSDLGCDYETLCKYNPKIIYGIAAGFGTRGPEGDQRAFDTAAQARSGFMMLTGDASGPPATAGGAVIDQAGATMLAYGILAALVARERMGIGQEVEASLLGSAIHLQAMAVNRATIQGKLWSQHDRLRAQNPLGNYYKCADGKWIMLAEVQSDRFWHDFCNALGIPELENDPRFATRHDRKVNDAECVSILDQVFETKPRDEWMTILREKAKGMACAEVFELTEVVHQPQVLENEYVVDYEHPVVGPVKLIGYPVRFSKTPAKIASKAPEFGEHTEEVLLTVGGYSWEEIESLRNEGII